MPVVIWWPDIGEYAFRYSLCLLPNVLTVSNIYSSLQSTMSHLYQNINTTLHCMGPLSFGDKRIFLLVLLPLKYVLMPFL